MRKLWLYAVIPAVMLPLASCQREEADLGIEPIAEETEEKDSPAIIPGEMIVELTEEMTAAIEKLSPEEAGEMLGVISARRLYEDGGEWEFRHREAGLHRWYRLTYDPAKESFTKAEAGVAGIPGVVYTEPVRKVKSTALFNDPDFYKQWHYYNDGTFGESHKAGCDINVVPVWENFTAGTNNVIVSVVDGGIDLTHYDLAAVTIPGGSNGSKNFVMGNYMISAHSHGTHVAGTIGAINNNGKGGCGIAGGSDGTGGVKLMSCQVFANNPDDPEHDLSGGFYSAMVWGADHGAVISQNSWGHVYKTAEEAAAGEVGSIKGAIDYFIKYAGTDKNGNQTGPMKGGVVIFAAGNEGWPDGWPAEYDAVIAVGATGPAFYRAYYSNYGPWVDICAPGGDVNYSSGSIYSTTPNNKYGWMQGTSMACPHVSGVAALLVSYFGGPGFTNEQLKARLLGGANKNVISTNAQIGPFLDAYGAFTFGSTTPPNPVTSFTVSARSNFLDFTWKVTKDPDDKKAYGYLIAASKSQEDIASLDPKNIPSSVKTMLVEVGSIAIGNEITGTVQVPEFNVPYYTTIVGYDYSGNYSAVSAINVVTTGDNHAPTIETSYTGSFEVKSHLTLNVDYSITDPDGHAVSTQFDEGSAAASLNQIPDGLFRLTIVGNVADPGNYTARIIATDEFGARTELAIPYTILPNHAPVITKDIDDMVYEVIGERLSINMDEYLHDPDGEQLTYNVDINPVGIIHLNQVGNVMNLTTMDFGKAEVTIKGVDSRGLFVELPFSVLVRKPDADPDVYPTLVEDYLHVSDGTLKEITVTLTNANGKILVQKTAEVSAFEPMDIDMRGCAPGRYGVKVESDGKSIKRTVVKL